MTTKGYIRYRSDYKYQLAEGYAISISIKPKSDIKTECEQVYQNIKLQQDKLKRLRSICKHPNTFKGNYSYRVGSICDAVICSDCNEIISTEWEKLREIKRKDI